MRISINRDPVNVFWSIIFIIANIYVISLAYDYNNIKSEGALVTCVGIYCITCAVSFIHVFWNCEYSGEVPLWTFASILNIAIILIDLLITTINSTIRYIFENPNVNSETNKPTWKKFISKLIGIK